MILVTVGAQMSFDRLVRAVDDWAAITSRHEVFAQIGPGGWRPQHMDWTEFLEPIEFRRRLDSAQLVVAHAGMGTILTCLQFGKPLIVMPRAASRKETRNDHQLATANRFSGHQSLYMATAESELIERLNERVAPAAGASISPFASPKLIAALRDFIQEGVHVPVKPQTSALQPAEFSHT